MTTTPPVVPPEASQAPLSERLRLHAGALSAGGMMDYTEALLREAAELASRMEQAPVVRFWLGAREDSFEVNTPEEAQAIPAGKRVAIVEVPNV